MSEKLEEILGHLRRLDGKVSSIRAPSLFGRDEAIFKAKIVKGSRITIPAQEVETLGLKEGDIVQVALRRAERAK